MRQYMLFSSSPSERDFYFFVPHPALAPAARAAASICSLVRGSLLLPDLTVVEVLLPSNWTVSRWQKFRCVCNSLFSESNTALFFEEEQVQVEHDAAKEAASR
mmetsp:Transcript_24830/g.35596  ORF Transcript_24830/g.35596 Transcript_24830/m.35596 type:complete len:103 (+) Transcript_24830:243-551(+)